MKRGNAVFAAKYKRLAVLNLDKLISQFELLARQRMHLIHALSGQLEKLGGQVGRFGNLPRRIRLQLSFKFFA